jgi:hypothetical protein
MQVIDDRLSVGSIIFEHVLTTNPPKNKYYISIGISDNKIALGTVYINTEINPNISKTPQLRSYHIPIAASDYPFLRYDSFIDCSNIQERLIADVESCITRGSPQYGYYATISATELQNIIHIR